MSASRALQLDFDDGCFHALVEQSRAAVFVYARGRTLYANQEAVRLCGRSREEILAIPPVEIVHPEDREGFIREERRLRHTNSEAALELRILRPDGTVRWVTFTTKTMDLQGHRVAMANAMDITRRVEAERKVRESREWLEMAQWAGRSAAWEWTPENDSMVIVGSAQDIYGIHDVEVPTTGAQVRKMIHSDDRQVLDDAIRESAATGRPFTVEHRLLLPGGEVRWISVRGQAIASPDGRVERILGVSADVTERRRAEAERAYLATHDHLTGLLNRRAFEERLQAATQSCRERGARHALCYVDLDDFKVVNDTCGHEAGDRLLGELATVLVRALPREDVLGRLGGDEFGFLFVECPPREAERRAQRLLDAIASFRFSWQGKVFRVGASIGLVHLDATSGTTGDILRMADGACYVAKAHGRNRIHAATLQDSEVARRHARSRWVQQLTLALDEDRFRLFSQPIVPFQPEVNPPMEEILLRLDAGNGELVEPSRFLPAAEHSRLMPQIDAWVIRKVVPALSGQAGARDHRDTIYTINLSGQSLGSSVFMEELKEILSGTGIPARRICFEITETAAIANLESARRAMELIRRMGYRFILDDFGSGLSSLEYLRALPVELLKIDGALVSGINDDPVLREIVLAIHRIGQTMRLRTIAESVETEAIYDSIRELGLDYCQGFWTGRPKPFFENELRPRQGEGE